ncbi:MAG TPA: anthranilate phosphoribosyltransferase, partial [Mariprofundaceae bacterium]|nr:anthranilate phosphoribosyltransferase [Mariprofundaceae bacterium]
MSMAMQDALRMVQAGNALSEGEAEQVFAAIMAGEATPSQIGALLMGLSIRGETPEVVAGAARAMRAAATTIHPHARPLL